MRAIDRTDLPMAIQDGGLEFRAGPAGENTIAWVRLPAGTDLRPGLVGLPADLCPCPHWGYMISGRLVMHTKDGDSTYEAGQAFHWAPGHAPEALEDCEYIDVSPTAELEEVVRHLQGGGA
ncbi:hypothetical protein [Blastococcus goldschmidtiae]|uniref:Cupin domain-containing protein n=1 Tax=Blastococcus goldschmidtiae TaxID=3075546 RepID=A0ABU2K8B9_9ACTN|nr:hypothetical protein [Blastococcus sp. DSM 46792]MDT0276439.1 hypothetical protein [Blastococcus sp. DSM 46792]